MLWVKAETCASLKISSASLLRSWSHVCQMGRQRWNAFMIDPIKSQIPVANRLQAYFISMKKKSFPVSPLLSPTIQFPLGSSAGFQRIFRSGIYQTKTCLSLPIWHNLMSSSYSLIYCFFLILFPLSKIITFKSLQGLLNMVFRLHYQNWISSINL